MEVNKDNGVIEKPYNVTSRDVGGLFYFTQPPRAVKGVIPDGDPDGQRGREEAGTIDIGD